MNKVTVDFKKVSKSYFIGRHKYGRLSETLSSVTSKLLGKNTPIVQTKFWALKNTSFAVKEGETLGIIGKNGSGKSTILKLISRITYPNKGEINVRGRVGAFIELGAGLHPDLSGRENIYLYGAILGMKSSEIDARFKEIVDFSEIHKFLDIPIKRYSTGMYSRLGFSVCAFCNPDILLVDEVLAVGDINFQSKCLVKMDSFSKSDKTVVFVSHDLEAIKKICSRVILLDHGKVVNDGKPSSAMADYLANYAQKSLE